MTRDHDVTQLSTAELELTMRENLSLITPDSLAHMRAIDAELARRADNRQARAGQRHDSWILPGPSPATLPGDVDRDKETRECRSHRR
jgi:hypothetical protein